MECYGYTTELFTHSAFQSLEKKAFQRRIKGLPWHSMKTVFGHNKQSIRVIFGALRLVEPGLMAGVRRNFGKSRVSKKLKLFYYPLCFIKARYRYSYIDRFRVVFSGEIYCKVVFYNAKSQKCVYKK